MIKINKKLKLSILLFLIVFVSGIFFVINNMSNWKKTKSNDNINSSELENEITVSGVAACLPVKDENLPHNDLCLFGIKTADGHYRLQSISDDKNNVVNKIRIGQKVEISGELLNENDTTYKTLGAIKVASIKFLETDEKEIENNLPKDFKANYILFKNYSFGIYKVEEYPHLEFWVENNEIKCNETPLGSSLSPKIRKTEINNNKFCVGSSSGMPGSIYTQYAYATVILDKVYTVIFAINYLNCEDYKEEEKVRCKEERENFNLDNLIGQEIDRIKN